MTVLSDKCSEFDIIVRQIVGKSADTVWQCKPRHLWIDDRRNRLLPRFGQEGPLHSIYSLYWEKYWTLIQFNLSWSLKHPQAQGPHVWRDGRAGATWEVRSVRQIVGKSADTVWQCKPQTPIQFILCTRRNIGHLFNLILLWSRSHDDKKQLRPCPSQVLLPQQTFRLLRWYHAEQGWGQEYPQAQGHTFEEIDVLEQRFCETDCRKICRHCKRVRDDNDWDLRPKSLKKKFQKKDPFPESFLAALTCWQFINQTCIEFWCQLALLCLQKKDMTKCAHFHVILHRFVCLGCTLCWKSSPPARKENLSWKGWMIRFIRKSSRGSSTLFLREKFYFCVRDTYSFYSEFIRRDMVRSFIQDTRLIFQEICAHVTCSQSKSTRFEETWSAYSRHLFSLFVVKIYSAFDLIQSILKLVHGDDDWIYTLYSRALVRGFNGRSRNKARRVNLDLEMTMTNDKRPSTQELEESYQRRTAVVSTIVNTIGI